MKTEKMSEINQQPKRLSTARDIVLVTHYNTAIGVWIPYDLLFDSDALIEKIQEVGVKRGSGQL